MSTLLAAAPLVSVVALMLALRWRAATAGAVGLILAVLIALAAFGLGETRLPRFGPAGALAATGVEALHLSFTVLWIVFPALAIYELQNRTGALAKIRDALSRISTRSRTQVILVAWFFGLFMEGAAGFGAPVALVAPLLVGLGHDPVRAVVLALVGHAAGVAFGALGTPVLTQAGLLADPAPALAAETAIATCFTGVGLLAALVWLAGPRPPTPGDVAMGAAAGLCFFLPYIALAFLAGPELPTIGAALIGGGAFALIARQKSADAPPLSGRELVVPLAPYLIIVGLIGITRLPPGASEALRSFEFAWSLGGPFRGAFQPLYHAGTMLAAGFLIGGLLQSKDGRILAAAAAAAARRLGPVALALLVMLYLSRVMVHGGLIAELAGAALVVGGLWPLLTPLLGAVGSFVTGSATASNILLTPFQVGAAEALDLPVTSMAAGQGAGAAAGNMTCPHNIIAGAATVGCRNRDAEILRMTAPVCLLALAMGGLWLWLSLN
ncbi:MAG: L-lactate permease [Phenylobacterium sp.]|uniref:L-lactate permease n=1 Tax=Phenylobacterium sp. TaxID=1871053 RepID=UPI003918C7D0